MIERAVSFACEGDELVGIIAQPEGTPSRLGVLVVVGGPQYRAGSHRQFVHLSRALASEGVACMRFDYRGMGDAAGAACTFEGIGSDIAAAVDEFMRQVPAIEAVVLWGLCDGASAACFYAPTDGRVAGLVLLNPWVRTEAGEAKTVLRHYYLRRLVDPGFWKKLFGGGVAVVGSIGGLLRAAQRARSGRRAAGKSGDDTQPPLPQRMARDLRAAGRPTLVLLSGRDYVAREFEQVVAADPAWSELCAAAHIERIEDADHTFSSRQWRAEVARLTANWIFALPGKNQEG